MVGSAAEPIDPMLGSFDVYAPGHTPLYPLLPGSVAINAVYCPAGVTTAQRGVSRPQGPYCDIGAYELESEWKYLFLPLIRR